MYDSPKPYEAPKLERLGTFRDITMAGGCMAMADAANPYHRYDPNYSGCPTTEWRTRETASHTPPLAHE